MTRESVAANGPWQGEIASLPAQVQTKGGAHFDPSSTVWAYRDGTTYVSLNFAFESALVPELRQAMRATLIWYAENHSPSHLANSFFAMKRFVRLKQDDHPNELICNIGAEDILSYRTQLAYALKRFAAFVKKWYALGHPGIDASAIGALADMTIRGNAIGEAVLTRDPISGPFTDIERAGIEDALNAAYSSGAMPEEHYLLAWLFMAIGARPAQFAAMKICDLQSLALADGSVQHVLRVPRAKQRSNLRDAFKDRLLALQIGNPLSRYTARLLTEFKNILPDPSQAPLFPRIAGGNAESDAEPSPNWNAYHRSAGSLSRTLTDALQRLSIRSERTGQPMRVTPRRLRYTFGTNAARESRGVLVVAELLDHSGIETAGVYVAASPDMAARIERATALQLAPLAQAFQGVLIKHESEATRSGDPASRIVDLRIDRSAKPMGSCGQHGFCGFLAPISCYTCQNFEPWLDGPHRAVLDFLLAERSKHAADARLAGINDRTILAVAQVVQLCEAITGGKEHDAAAA